MGSDVGVPALVNKFVMLGMAGISLVVAAMCQIPRVKAVQANSSPPTFYKDVLPILQDRCQSCHRSGASGPMPLVTYEQSRPWAKKIAAAVQMKIMPPWFADPRFGHFANDPSLSTDQIATLTAWADAGAPSGDPVEAPAARTWSAGWSIPQPDVVVKMAKPVQIAAQGEMEYTYEIVPTHFTEDKWVQMLEVNASSGAHVHHGVVYIRPPDSPWLRHAPVGEAFTASMLKDPEERQQAHETTSDLLLVYAPGSAPDRWADGIAKFVPAGADVALH